MYVDHAVCACLKTCLNKLVVFPKVRGVECPANLVIREELP